VAFKSIRYNQGEGLVKIKIEEPSGALLENWTIMMSDLGKWVRLMKRKYGKLIDREEPSKDKDIDWIK